MSKRTELLEIIKANDGITKRDAFELLKEKYNLLDYKEFGVYYDILKNQKQIKLVSGHLHSINPFIEGLRDVPNKEQNSKIIDIMISLFTPAQLKKFEALYDEYHKSILVKNKDLFTIEVEEALF